MKVPLTETPLLESADPWSFRSNDGLIRRGGPGDFCGPRGNAFQISTEIIYSVEEQDGSSDRVVRTRYVITSRDKTGPCTVTANTRLNEYIFDVIRPGQPLRFKAITATETLLSFPVERWRKNILTDAHLAAMDIVSERPFGKV